MSIRTALSISEARSICPTTVLSYLKVRSWSSKTKSAVASKRVACNANLSRHRNFLSPYRIPCCHISKRLRDEAKQLEATDVKVPKMADYGAGHIQRGPVLFVRSCVEKPIAHGRPFQDDRRPMVVERLRSVDGELHVIVSGQSVLADPTLDVGRVSLFCDVLLLS